MATVTKVQLRPSGTSNINMRGDAGKICSQMNHRLYRQGRNYKIRIGVNATATRFYEVYALRNDWMIHASWKLAFQTFMNNSKEELDAAAKNGLKARWLDFRTEFASTSAGDLQACRFSSAGAAVAVTGGEFVSSIVTNEAGVPHTFRWDAPSGAGLYNPIEEYQRTGNANASPSTPTSTSAYSGLDDDQQDGQLAHLSDAGNLPPYDANTMGTLSPFVLVGVIGGGATTSQQLSTGYFDAPCGLFFIRRVDNQQIGTLEAEFFIEYAKGDYKGISAPSMGTAKLVKNHYEVK